MHVQHEIRNHAYKKLTSPPQSIRLTEPACWFLGTSDPPPTESVDDRSRVRSSDFQIRPLVPTERYYSTN